MNLTLNSFSPEETFRFGVSLGRILKGRELILLTGNLGAGKTMFTKGIGHAMNVQRREIVSPSYTLMNIYEGKFKLYHIDLYRIDRAIKNGVPEIDDNLDSGIIIVEWAEYIKDLYSKEKDLIEISISFSHDNECERTILISTEIEIPPDSFI